LGESFPQIKESILLRAQGNVSIKRMVKIKRIFNQSFNEGHFHIWLVFGRRGPKATPNIINTVFSRKQEVFLKDGYLFRGEKDKGLSLLRILFSRIQGNWPRGHFLMEFQGKFHYKGSSSGRRT